MSNEASADLLLRILNMEEGYVDWAEIQRSQIEQMGLENYLTIKPRTPRVSHTSPKMAVTQPLFRAGDSGSSS